MTCGHRWEQDSQRMVERCAVCGAVITWSELYSFLVQNDMHPLEALDFISDVKQNWEEVKPENVIPDDLVIGNVTVSRNPWDPALVLGWFRDDTK